MAISEKADAELQSVMFDLNALTLKHDARALAAGCLSKAAYLYQQLRMLGHETPDSLQRIFQYGYDRTVEDGEPARVLGETAPSNEKAN